MRTRAASRSRRSALVGLTALALATVPAVLVVTGGPAAAAGPPSPPSCGTALHPVNVNNTPMALSAAGTPVVNSTIVVAGAGVFITDVDVITNITHTFSTDLDVSITSPAGTIVTLTTDNGSTFDNVFNGTRWNDDIDPGTTMPSDLNQNEVAEHTYANLTPVPNLLPEEALGAFTGENPNGVWTLRVADDTNQDGGSLAGWTLDLTSSPTAPSTATATRTNSTPAAISATGQPVVDSTLNVTGVNSYLSDVNVVTSVTHTFSGDLDMSITSPAGTVVTLTTDNGSTFDNVFNGTAWDDDIDPGTTMPNEGNQNEVREHTYVNLTPVPNLLPEEALGAFVGENPNGVWTLRVADDTSQDGGSLANWTLVLRTATCGEPPPPQPDTTVTGATASASPTQKIGKKGLVVVSTVGATAEPLVATVSGQLSVTPKKKKGHRAGTKTYNLATQQISLPVNAKVTVNSVLEGSKKKVKKTVKKLVRALAAKAKASVVLTFTFKDAAGNVKTVTSTVKIKAPKKKRR